jgi:hypothetical protein
MLIYIYIVQTQISGLNFRWRKFEPGPKNEKNVCERTANSSVNYQYCFTPLSEKCIAESNATKSASPPMLTGLTSLAKYDSRMSSLELAHQCLVVWNTLIAFRKLDMSRYMDMSAFPMLAVDCLHLALVCVSPPTHSPRFCPLQEPGQVAQPVPLAQLPVQLLLRISVDLPEGVRGSRII